MLSRTRQDINNKIVQDSFCEAWCNGFKMSETKLKFNYDEWRVRVPLTDLCPTLLFHPWPEPGFPSAMNDLI